MFPIDLHVHSNVSDGVDTPEALVRLAAAVPLSAFALTDHDTVDGVERARLACQALGEKAPELIPGVEISAGYGGRDIHILGLFVNDKNASFREALAASRKRRDDRNEQMAERFVKAGIPMTLKELSFGDPNAIITRAHFARYLTEHGITKDNKDAFDRFLGDTSPFYVPREYMSPETAVREIHHAGGLAVLAHPLSYRFSDEQILAMVRQLKEQGLDGVEAVYGAYSREQEATVRELAKRFDLLLSGGSDYHGSNKPGLMLGTGYGSLCVPYAILTALREARKQGNESA